MHQRYRNHCRQAISQSVLGVKTKLAKLNLLGLWQKQDTYMSQWTRRVAAQPVKSKGAMLLLGASKAEMPAIFGF